MRYFIVMIGLRGCYIPDSSRGVAVKTRRELKELLTDEAKYATNYGESSPMPSKRDIAAVAAALWRRSYKDRDHYLSTVLPTGEGYGIQVNPISGVEYRASLDEE
jgi:hypothetical protein